MCFPRISVQFLSERFRTKFSEVGELAEAEFAEAAPYNDSFEPLATEEEAVSNNARMDQEAEQISQFTNTDILPIIQQIQLFHMSVVLGSVSCFLLLLFFPCRYGLSLLLLCSQICCSILNCS